MGKTTTLVVMLLTVGLAGAAHAQEAATEEESRPRRTIRVLQHPYDLAAFYSARPGAPSVTPPVPHDPAYALAGHYRSRHVGPADPGRWIWAAFWARGYAAHRPTPLRGYRRSIGENGDLFLAVPFLAPVGPLSGAFPGF
jgi:hypothetical protein